MRYVEIENGRVRYVLPAGMAEKYQILPPNGVEIALDAEVVERDVYDAVTAPADVETI